MQHRKFIPILLMAVILCFSGLHAQQQAIDKMAKAMTDSLAYLQLDGQQKTTAEGLNKTAATSLAQLAQKAKTDTSLKGKAMFQQVAGIMKKRNAELVKILNQQQQQLY